MNWEDLPQVRKGNIGEEIVERHLNANGFVVYRPTSGPHPFDRLCASADKRRIFIAEVKTKARRQRYPDTGFDWKHFDGYSRIAMKHSMDVYVFWVTQDMASVYGGELINHLNQPRQIWHAGRVLKYPLVNDGIIYFPIEAMEHIASLTREQCAELRRHTTGKWNGDCEEEQPGLFE